MIARNPVHEDSRDPVAALLGTAFATSDRPDVVGFKSLYCFARDEGYPLKQHCFPTLSAPDRAAVVILLNQPVAAVSTPTPQVGELFHYLEAYLRTHTDILVD
ncbi:MAG: hypothetical protein J6386_08290 [Candidatus Synoicihabitans palmerolidicus]|nr:hypothetical protein [Candidatus Synoicihabitans palmerolidicus]